MSKYSAKVFITVKYNEIEAKDKDSAQDMAWNTVADLLKEYGLYNDFDIDCVDVEEVKT